jgi:hypothetical protein
MFSFFQRGEEFLQCEIRGDDASGYEIVITEPRRPERREAFSTLTRGVSTLGRAAGILGLGRLVGDRTAGTERRGVSHTKNFNLSGLEIGTVTGAFRSRSLLALLNPV